MLAYQPQLYSQSFNGHVHGTITTIIIPNTTPSLSKLLSSFLWTGYKDREYNSFMWIKFHEWPVEKYKNAQREPNAKSQIASDMVGWFWYKDTINSIIIKKSINMLQK